MFATLFCKTPADNRFSDSYGIAGVRGLKLYSVKYTQKTCVDKSSDAVQSSPTLWTKALAALALHVGMKLKTSQSAPAIGDILPIGATAHGVTAHSVAGVIGAEGRIGGTIPGCKPGWPGGKPVAASALASAGGEGGMPVSKELCKLTAAGFDTASNQSTGQTMSSNRIDSVNLSPKCKKMHHRSLPFGSTLLAWTLGRQQT